MTTEPAPLDPIAMNRADDYADDLAANLVHPPSKDFPAFLDHIERLVRSDNVVDRVKARGLYGRWKLARMEIHRG